MSTDSPFKHVVVVMLENRSFLNVLGGILGTVTSSDANTYKGTTYGAQNQTTQTTNDGVDASFPPTCIPLVDPGELFIDMSQQYLNWSKKPDSNPYSSYKPSDATMGGFVANYAAPYGALGGGNLQDVMNYFSAEQLPVTAFLATHYPVCESWYAPVPTQTFTNRVFALCAAPGVGIEKVSAKAKIYSWVDDLQYLDAHTIYEVPSLLSVLDHVLAGRAGFTSPYWKLYFHDYSIIRETLPYVASAAASSGNVNVSTFDSSDWNGATPPNLGKLPPTFLEDVANDALPPFAFIEPRYSNTTAAVNLPPNSNHPGGSAFGFKSVIGVSDTNPPIDMMCGELFLMQVYNALRQSKSWPETMLIITYDEAGGLYDPQAPPAATPPGSSTFLSR